ncbi:MULTISPECIES: DUF917 family protein [unclassified Paenibacillus]|uniref:DUF917 domain-containing protein n=1 Tax=unclassified Paenibacillus TaxID=185978 RepID=UPI001C1230D2|nr:MULTISPECIES: DUF917 family protein [unclassified Paenibacillus]MBU5441191.1 DUF917 family protein [Paenibacillus sp. MSJ-34]CAH0120483.1 hypothetical protein PAE9249_03002 [Paenibacillus sp. CECT 9249]
MAIIEIDEKMMEAAVLGGAVLGGGGGGPIEEGLQLGRLALEVGHPQLFTIDEMNDDDWVVTVSAVGAPAAADQYVKPVHYIRALELLTDKLGHNISAMITNENGASTTVNGWFQSAVTGMPVLDAPCNGRAHPTGSMGSMNLSELESYVSVQGAAGGKGKRYTELCASGSVEHVSTLVRQASVEAGGMIAVARNPVQVSYVKENGCPGAISQAIRIGQAMQSHQGLQAVEAVASLLGGRLVDVGQVTEFELRTTGGFDVGFVKIGSLEMTFWNEYMTLEARGERIATFPDLIMTFDAESGLPLESARIGRGRNVAVIAVPRHNLILGATMRNRKLLQPIEEIVGKPILSYIL